MGCTNLCGLSKEATVVLQIIAELYRLDGKSKSLEPPEKLEYRQQFLKPVLLRLESYLLNLKERQLPRSQIMKAVNYTLNQWSEILRIIDDSRYHLDNNSIEREIRPIAVGRKNYLFAGSHDAAKRAAVIYSLFGTAKLHKVNPYDWLKSVFQNMRSCPVNQVSKLLPQNFNR